MGKVKEYALKDAPDWVVWYQFPMGKVNSIKNVDKNIQGKVSIPYGKGKGNTSRRVLVSWSLVYQFPMGKVKQKNTQLSKPWPSCINSLWER